MRLLLPLCLILVIYSIGQAQVGLTFALEQPPPLVVQAGDDQIISPGDQIQLGGAPTAEGGLAQYSYLWAPASYLDDPTSPNPIATPEEDITYTVEVNDGRCRRTDEVRLQVQATTSTNEEIAAQFELYPNPAESTLWLRIPTMLQGVELRVEIHNIQGGLAWTRTLKATGELEIDVSGLPTATYLVRLKGNGIDLTKRIVIQ